jgi:hypothetical protein
MSAADAARQKTQGLRGWQQTGTLVLPKPHNSRIRDGLGFAPRFFSALVGLKVP